MTIDFDNLINKTALLCAVEGYKFRLGNLTFEAIEDEDDGYRSCMEKLEVVENIRATFKESVSIVESKIPDFEGYELQGKFGTILKVGTDYNDGYYPVFTFDYNPQLLSCNVDLDTLLNTIDE